MVRIEAFNTGNRLLDQLNSEDLGQLSRRMDRQTVPLHGTLLSPGEPVNFAYFPITNVLSSIVVMRDGSAVEAAAIGNEGLAGVGLLTGERSSAYLLVQQVEGECLRVPADHFRSVLRDSGQLRDVVVRYALILLQQCSQNAACNVRHGADERMSRWILACADRADRNQFDITQDYLGIMLGISRQSVSAVIASLQRQDLISYRRRHLKILDRAGLERSSCECYDVAVSAYEDLMGLGA